MDLGAELLELIGQRLGAPPAGVHDHQHRPGRQVAAAEAMRSTASLPASAADSRTTTRSSANSDGLSSSASSLVDTSPARSRFTGTSSVPAAARAARST